MVEWRTVVVISRHGASISSSLQTLTSSRHWISGFMRFNVSVCTRPLRQTLSLHDLTQSISYDLCPESLPKFRPSNCCLLLLSLVVAMEVDRFIVTLVKDFQMALLQICQFCLIIFVFNLVAVAHLLNEVRIANFFWVVRGS